MSMTEEKIIKILREINEDILTYKGDDMLSDGIVNSFSFISILSTIEEEFGIEIDEDLLEGEYLGNMDRIISTVNAIIEGRL